MGAGVLFAGLASLSGCDDGPVDPADHVPLEPVVVRTAEVWDAVESHPYEHELLAAGGSGSYEWRVTGGGLPDGLALDRSTGVIAGTPSTHGAWTFTVEATSGSADPGSRQFTLTVHPALTVTTRSLPQGEVGMSYAAILEVSGGVGTVRWSDPASALPEGLSLDERGSGELTGFPEVSGSFEIPLVIEQGTARTTHVLELEIRSPRPAPAPWPGVEPWSGFRGDARRTAYVPVTLEPSAFTARWRSYLGDQADDRVGGEIVSTAGVALTVDGPGHNATLVALDLTSGARLWSERRAFGWGRPGTASGHVYATTSEGSSSELVRLDPGSGETALRVPFPNQFYRYHPPVVKDGTIVTAGGHHGGIMGFEEEGGGVLWSHFRSAHAPERDAPAVIGSRAYWDDDGMLQGLDLRTGAVEVEIPGTCGCSYAPVVAAEDRILVPADGGGVAAVDPTTESHAWSHPSWGLLATDGERVYLAHETGVDVLDARTGQVVRQWSPPHEGFDPSGMVLTENLLFLLFGGDIHAVDVRAWTEVWHYPGSGTISLSEGMLLLHGEDKIVTGIDLGSAG